MTDAATSCMRPGVTHGERYLWLAVIEQALVDVRDEMFDSLLYNQAAAFFSDGGYWRRSREEIADLLGVTAEQIQAAGLRIVNARRLEQGLQPVLPRPTTPRAPAPAARRAEARVPPPPRPPLPLLVAYHPAPDQPAPTPKGNGWRRRYSHNPFDPYRPLPSECRDAAD